MNQPSNLIADSRGTPASVWRAATHLQHLPRLRDADEDVHLVRDLERSGARIVWTHQTCVTTSARRDYRARGGFGEFLQALAAP